MARNSSVLHTCNLNTCLKWQVEDIAAIGGCFEADESRLEAYVAILAHVTDVPRGRPALEGLLGKETYFGAYRALAGNLFNFNRANITGHYRLDMSVLGDRMVLKRRDSS